MKRILFLILCAASTLLVQSQSYRADIYNAFVTGDMARWETILSKLEQTYKTAPNHKILEEIVEYQYGFIGYLIGSDQKTKAAAVLKKAIENLDVLMARNDKISRYWAYKSAFIGFKIGISPIKAPFLGQKSFDYIDEAMKLDENNPYTLVEFANGRYYAPGFAGGDKVVALEKFREAIAILERDSLTIKGNWYYLMAKTKYGNMLMENDQPKEALKVFDAILRFEPNYTWVSEELKPNAIKFQK